MYDTTYTKMDIWTPPGSKVIFTNAGGYESEQETNIKYLELGKEYTVDYIDVHGWSSDVFLEEIPGRRFNTCCFNNIKGYDPLNDWSVREADEWENKYYGVDKYN